MKPKNYSHHDCGLRYRQAAWSASALVTMAFVALAVIMTPRCVSAEPRSIWAPAAEGVAAAAEAYWTAKRMQNAIPMDLGAVSVAAAQLQAGERQWPADAIPGFAPGWRPGSGPQPTTNGSVAMVGAQLQTSPPFSPPASPTDFGNYSPFQRFNLPMRYMTYPFSTIGKLFFTQNGLNYVCSASVIGNRAIATAGHCVHDGSGNISGWSSNFLFCPSYNIGGVNPARGCWAWSYAATSAWWYGSAAFDRDYACIVTAPTGTVLATTVGAITGATGRAWNWPTRQAEFAFGYPSAAPFPGTEIIAATSTEWYEVDMTPSDGQVSKYIGNDMTGGSSGGPWWLNLNHPTREYADTDGSSLTDPNQGVYYPWINGVNSHRRCSTSGCPAGTLFTQEMGSPQFMSTAGDTDESEDIFAACFASGG